MQEEAIKALYETIGNEITSDKGPQYFYLPKVVKDKKANPLGYSQVFYILGNSIGLKVTVVDVLELAAGPPPVGKPHVACSVSLSDGTLIMVGIAQEVMDKPFVFKKMFGAVGNYWGLRQKDDVLGLPRRIQFVDERGLVGIIYDSLASEYAKAGHFSEAITLCTNAIALNPRYAEAYVSRGIACGKSRRSAQALSDFAKAVELDPSCAEAYSSRGAHYNDLGQYKMAIPDLSKAIELNPKYALAYCNRGIAYNESGQSAEALADLTKAIALNPKLAEAFAARGSAYDGMGQYAQAISDYDRAIALNPQMALAYFDRGIAHGKAGNSAEAISDFSKAIEIDPQMADAYFMRGVAYAALGTTDEARTDMRKATALNPGLKAEVKRVSDQYKLGL